jgi:hypothetical protein
VGQARRAYRPAPPLRLTGRFTRPAVDADGCSAACYKDIFPTVIVEWLSGKAAVERLQLKAGDIEEAEPFVLRGPPQ